MAQAGYIYERKKCPDCDPAFPGLVPCSRCSSGGPGVTPDTCQSVKACDPCPTCSGPKSEVK